MAVNRDKLPQIAKPLSGQKNRVTYIQPPWDERFWMGAFPNYDPLRDEHCEGYKHILSKNKYFKLSKQRNSSSRPGSSKRSSSKAPSDKSGSSSHAQLMITEEILNALKQDLEQEWAEKQIPEVLRQQFKDCVYILGRHKAAVIIAKEIEDLQNESSLIQLCLRAIEAREESIKSIVEMNEYLAKCKGWDKMPDVQMECAELLQAYRMLSLNAVESIIKWREQHMYALLLNQTDLGHKPTYKPPFMWNEQNYLKKMQNDMLFLHDSAYIDAFTIDAKSDPFIVAVSNNNSVRSTKQNSLNVSMDKGKAIIPINKALLNRIRTAEMVIFEDDNDEQLSTYNSIMHKGHHSSIGAASDLDMSKLQEPGRVMNEKLTNAVYRDIVEEAKTRFIRETLREILGREIDNAVVDLVYKNILNETQNRMMNEVVEKGLENERTAQYVFGVITGEFMSQAVQNIVEDVYSEEMKKIENAEMKKKILEEQARRKQEEENLRKKRIEDETLRKKLEEEEKKRMQDEAKNKKLEDERLRKKQLEEEAFKKKLEDEERKKLQEEAKHKKLEDERLRKKQLEEETFNKKLEDEDRKRLELEEKNRKLEETKKGKTEEGKKKKGDKKKKGKKGGKKKKPTGDDAERKKKLEEDENMKKKFEDENMRKKKEEEETLRKKQDEEKTLRKKQDEEETLRKKQEEEQEALRKKQEEEETLRNKLAEEEALKKKIADEVAFRKRQEEEEIMRNQLDQEAFKKYQEEQETLRKKQEEEEQEALRNKQAEEQALRKKQAEEQEETLRKKQADEQEALRIKLAEEEALRIKLAEEEALRKKLDDEEALRKKLAEDEALRMKLTEDEALRNKLAEDEALRMKLAEEKALRMKLAEDEALMKRASTMEIFQNQAFKDICRNIIETLIQQENIPSLAEEVLRDEISLLKQQTTQLDLQQTLTLKEKEIEDCKLIDIFYKELIESFLDRLNLSEISTVSLDNFITLERRRTTVVPNIDLSTSIIEVAEDNVMEAYTPGAHSPNNYTPDAEHSLVSDQISAENTINSDQPEELDFNFTRENLAGFEFYLQPIAVLESQLHAVLDEYYELMPRTLLDVSLSIDSLLIDATKVYDPCWFFIMCENLVTGLLVYSRDLTRTGHKIIISHLSTLNYSLYRQGISLVNSWIMTNEICDEIRIQLYSELNKNLISEIKQLYSELGFSWKAHSQLSLYKKTASVMGLRRPESIPLNNSRDLNLNQYPIHISGYTVIQVSPAEIPPKVKFSDEMWKLGNRQCLINAILAVIGKTDQDVEFTRLVTNGLQQDVSDILEIINMNNAFKIPNMKFLASTNSQEISAFLEASNHSLPTPMEGRQAASIFELSNKLVGCSIVPYMISGSRYRYIRFQNSEIICAKSQDGSEIYLLPTDSPSLNLFFVRTKNLTEELKGESKRMNSDLYSKVEDLLKHVEKTPQNVEELWVPAFMKNLKWEIPWVEGYYIPSQTPIQNDMYITKAYEEITVGLNVPLPAAGLLNIEKPKGPVLQEDIVMGIMHRKVDKILDLPLFVCLIEKEDMLRI